MVTDENSNHSEMPRGLFASWKFWLGISLLILIGFAVGYPVVRHQRNLRLMEELDAADVWVSAYVPKSRVADICESLLRPYGVTLDWFRVPHDVLIRERDVYGDTFQKLSQLDLEEFEGREIRFVLDDALKFIARSPRLQRFELYHSTEIPVAVVERLRRERSGLTVIQTGVVIPGVEVRSIWPGLEIELVNRAWFPELEVGEVFVAVDGEPLETFHQVRERLRLHESDDLLEFTIRGLDGTERTVRYDPPPWQVRSRWRRLSLEER